MDAKHLTRVEIKDEDRGEVAAVFSTFDVIDSDGDVTEKGAFTDGAPVAISAYGHQSWKGALPVGKGRIREVGNEAVMEGRFFLDTTHGADTFKTVKALSADDSLQEWSYSLHNVQARRGEFDGKQVRFIERVDVHEVSPVLKGAGIGTRTLETKGALKFSEHAQSVVADVDELVARAAEVVALRAEKGKTISPESADLMAVLEGSVKELAERLAELVAPPTPHLDDDDAAEAIAAEFLRFVASHQGVTT